jgi:hypothetical protein
MHAVLPIFVDIAPRAAEFTEPIRVLFPAVSWEQGGQFSEMKRLHVKVTRWMKARLAGLIRNNLAARGFPRVRPQRAAHFRERRFAGARSLWTDF